MIRTDKVSITFLFSIFMIFIIGIGCSEAQDKIIHDGEYYILLSQNKEKWAEDNKVVEQKLKEFKEKNGGKPPNILYILIDDVGFGEMGTQVLNYVRGDKLPRINDFANQSLSFARMYTEPSCTPTRVAFMTGRQPFRMGMGETSVALSGFGLPANEVTIAEILSKSGYNTAHVGKWHMGDIEEAYPTNQGFDYAAFPIHQQAQLALFSNDNQNANQLIGLDSRQYGDTFTLDRTFRPVPGAMVTGVEGVKGEPVNEVYMDTGEEWTQKKYMEMNQRYQNQAIEQLQKLSKEDKPFFLQYWPLLPLTFTRADVEKFESPNGGSQVEALQHFDAWLGDILDEVDKLGIAENTLIIFMGDNGNFTKYQPYSGFSPMIYRGGKGDTTEGGVRVDAFARWPGMLEPGSMVGDMIHVADLFTTIARISGATDLIPTDRVIDGVDQTSMMFLGDSHGRRDTVFLYSGPVLQAVVKEQYKLHMPPPGENFIGAKWYDLYRDPREEFPVSTQIGAWAAASMIDILKRHQMTKKKYPDTPPATDRPYTGIANLRPESMQLVEQFMSWQPKPKQ